MKQTIEVEVDVPQGYVLRGYSQVSPNDFYLDACNELKIWEGEKDSVFSYFVLDRKEPRRRIFECVSEEPMIANRGEWFGDDEALALCSWLCTSSKHKIWKEVIDE